MANNYLLLYHGGGMPASQEEQARVMQQWTEWFGVLGDRLVDGGNPVSQTKRIAVGGSVSDEANGPTGYSIIKAETLDQAVELAKGCPVLQGGASIEVAETFAAM
jgi:hypothetical protein